MKNSNLDNLININNRIIYGKEIRDFFINSNKKIFTSKQYNNILILYTTKNKILKYLTDHLGAVGGSIDAEAYKLELPNNIKLAIKIIPLAKNELNKFLDNSYKSWKELEILKTLYTSIKDYTSPNIPIIYFYFICKNMKTTDYLNPNIQKYYNNLNIRNSVKDKIKQDVDNDSLLDILNRMNKKKGFGQNSLCIMNELCDTTIKDLLYNIEIEKINDNIFKSFIFQILNGLYCIHKYNIAHFDLHGGNILISYIKSGKYWAYNVGNKKYYICNYGYILKLWDFGRSIIINENNLDMLINGILQQVKRFYKNIFKYNKNFVNDVKELLNISNIKIILFAFDLWRIVSYLYSKIKAKEYLSLKFKKTLKLLTNIKKDCEYNWIYPLINKQINVSFEKFNSYLLNKYFHKFTVEKTEIINNIEYMC
tara:strand:- start:612 stop:1883 length:1272 start_codon:yes stop_codon:yes gene_type:complete